METQKLGTIAFLMDDRLSREKAQIVMRVINALRHHVKILLLRHGASEQEVIEKLEESPIDLILVPWHLYFDWSRVEAFYGLTRTSGPTFAGYFADQVRPRDLGDHSDHFRSILLDFNNTTPAEAALLVRTLIQDRSRAGIRPLVGFNAPIYAENWFMDTEGVGPGARVDRILELPELNQFEWNKRAAALRIAVMALWNLVFEEGPGKGDLTRALSGKAPKASFQLGISQSCLTFRLCYSMSNWSPKDALKAFTLNAERPCGAAQLLLQYADFVRVHTIAETPDVEVVAGFFKSAPAEKTPGMARTLWVEPLAPQLISEVPFEMPSAASPHLKAIEYPSKDRMLFAAASRNRELEQLLREKEELIRELKSGGVGAAAPLSPPEAEELLEAFQQRYCEARFQIRQLELEVASAERNGASPEALQELNQRIQALMNREKVWIHKLAEAIETFRESRKRQSSG